METQQYASIRRFTILAIVAALAFVQAASGVGITIKISGVMPDGAGVYWHGSITPDSQFFLYTANQRLLTAEDLFATPVDGNIPPILVGGPTAPDRGVDNYVITPDLSHVIYSLRTID